MPRIAIIGAGVSGLVCAHRLTQTGIECDVYERWPGLGGQAATLDVGDGVRLERYYHYLFTSDSHMIGLFGELGLADDLVPHNSDSAILSGGRLWPFNGAMDLLRFGPLPVRTRLRMGAAFLWLQFFGGDLASYESRTAKSWIEAKMGRAAWERVWGPLMRGKFGERAESISMAWIWDKMVRRRNVKEGESRQEVFLYPRNSFEPLFSRLVNRIEQAGGRVLIDTPAAQIERAGRRFRVTPGAPGSFRRGLDPREFDRVPTHETYDCVVCCLPNETFLELVSDGLRADLGADYRERLESIEYFTALTMLLELDRPLTDHFWVNIADRRSPFVGLIEHSNFIGWPGGGEPAFSYVSNYLPPGHRLLDLGPDELLNEYEDGLRLINPGFERSWIRNRWLFREPAGQPIVDVGYHKRIPSNATPVDGLYLVNTTQIYPEDRGTNYAVRDGDAVAKLILERLSG